MAVLLPLWAGYLVKGYAWRAMFSPGSRFSASGGGGVLDSVVGWSPGFGRTAIVVTLAYQWLPYMVLPIYAGLDRLPPSLLVASADLGGRPLKVTMTITLTLIARTLIAGWLLAFTLSLDDLVIASFVSGPGSSTLPMVVFSSVRLGLSPEINALATILLGSVIIGAFAAWRLFSPSKSGH